MALAVKQKSKRTRAGANRSRTILKKIIEAALRERFPHDTVEVSDGFEDNIHALVVSKVFDKMTERTKFAHLWKIVEGTDLNDSEKDLITALIAYSPRELM
ncbi:MAG TPA: hypothetical protein VFE47_22760 [Tepidisphaeraceae bacterium]|jgi:hypothetical protein|nr:hypothetical protein [Tepidisphaeraceae bacterium]